MRVLLADDHALFLEGLQNLMVGRGVQVVGAARDGLEALDKARQLSPDVILMDIRMPRCDGLTATRLIKTELPQIKIVMLTTSADDADLFEAIRSGASGYLLKNLEADEFFGYLDDVEKGHAPISRELATKLVNEFARRADLSDEPPASVRELNERQYQVLTLVAQGLSYKEVGDSLGLSEHTIKYHMGDILRRFHLKNREQVVAYALRTGLVKQNKTL